MLKALFILICLCLVSCSEKKEINVNKDWLNEAIKNKQLAVDMFLPTSPEREVKLSPEQVDVFMRLLCEAVTCTMSKTDVVKIYRESAILEPAPALAENAAIYVNWAEKRNIKDLRNCPFIIEFYDTGLLYLYVKDEELKKKHPDKVVISLDDAKELHDMINKLIE